MKKAQQNNDEWFRPYNAPESELKPEFEGMATVDQEGQVTASSSHGGGLTLVEIVLGIGGLGLAMGVLVGALVIIGVI